jgi:hypothetical protein
MNNPATFKLNIIQNGRMDNHGTHAQDTERRQTKQGPLAIVDSRYSEDKQNNGHWQ